MKTLAYRPDIDGIRAIAVLAVILFHAGFSLFSGGYVGVDIFFVISGYLITTFILKEKQAGHFLLKDFYIRRAKRILPALFFVITCGLPAAWIFLLPNQLLNFSQSLMAVLLFIPNFFFWKTSGYFDASSELKPLIHTWSLGVEEQFYLFFPLLFLVWGYFKFKLERLFWVCVIVLIASLFASNYGWRHHAMANFFLLPARMWELLIGALLAFFQMGFPCSLNFLEKYKSFLSVLGLSLIIYSILFFSRAVPTPSFFTLIPTIGTLLVIAFSQGTLVYRLLSMNILVRIGLVSYSAYLWHQPLFAFTRLYYSTSLSIFIYAILIGLTFFLAYLTWLYIELPFRKSYQLSHTLKKILLYIFWLLFVSFSIASFFTKGFEGRFKISQKVVKSFALPERSKECFDLEKGHVREDWSCLVSRVAVEKNVQDFFLAGDSHALQLLSVFEDAAKLTGKNGEFAGFSGCIPLLGVYPLIRDDQENKNCAALNQRVLSYVKTKHIKNIILVARWTYYTNGSYKSESKLINFIGKNKFDSPNINTSRAAFEYGLKQTINTYKTLGVHIYIITQVPAQLFEPQAVYYDAFGRSGEVQKTLDKDSVSFAQHLNLQSYVVAVFEKYKKDSSVTIINFDSDLCNEKNCPIGTSTESYYQDNNHLSAFGAARLQSKLIKMLQSMASDKPLEK